MLPEFPGGSSCSRPVDGGFKNSPPNDDSIIEKMLREMRVAALHHQNSPGVFARNSEEKLGIQALLAHRNPLGLQRFRTAEDATERIFECVVKVLRKEGVRGRRSC